MQIIMRRYLGVLSLRKARDRSFCLMSPTALLPLWHAEGLQLELVGWSDICLSAPEGEGDTLYAAR